MRFAMYGLIFAALVFLISGAIFSFTAVLCAATRRDLRPPSASRALLVPRREEMVRMLRMGKLTLAASVGQAAGDTPAGMGA